MGHDHLGHLPKTLRWTRVMDLLDASPNDTAAVASAVAKAIDFRLRRLGKDQGLGYSFWLLVRIAQAARTQDFIGNLARLNVAADPGLSTIQFISRVTDTVRAELQKNPSSGDFAEIGSLALRTALTDTVGQQGRSLFGTSLDDLQGAFRAYSTQRQFATVAHRFFSDFFARLIRSYIDRDLSNHVGEGRSFPILKESKEFLDALDRHTRQSSRIVEEFAGSWYSKHGWESKGEISREETQRFVAHALHKLRAELEQQAAAS